MIGKVCLGIVSAYAIPTLWFGSALYRKKCILCSNPIHTIDSSCSMCIPSTIEGKILTWFLTHGFTYKVGCTRLDDNCMKVDYVDVEFHSKDLQ